LDVVPVLSNVIRSLFVPIIFFAFTLIPQGALKALRQQKNAAYSLLFCFYFISLPSAYYLAMHTELGVQGLWMGFAVGQIVLFLLYNWLIMRTDW
jgi:MATE family multidrug resistance protein